MPRRLATNRIQSVLDALGIDWHSPRYGRPREPGNAGVITVEDNGAFGSLLGPLRADGRMELDARQPPAIIQGDAWQRTPFWRNAGRANLARVQDVLAAHLGEAEDVSAGAVVSRRWRDQAGSITLTCWPDRGRFDDIDAFRDDRLEDACKIEIVSGWRRPLTAQEAGVIDDMTVVGRGTPRGVRALTSTPATDDDIAYVREPGHDPLVLDGVVGVDKATRTLIACPGRLLVIPIERLRSLRHEAYAQGISAGHSAIVAQLEGGASLVVAEHDETHGLELVSRGLSRALDMTLEHRQAIAS